MWFAKRIKLPPLNVCTLFHGCSGCTLPAFLFRLFFFFIIFKRPGRKRRPIQIRLEMWSSISHGAHVLLLFHGSSCGKSTREHESSVVPVIVLIGRKNVSLYCCLVHFLPLFFWSALTCTMYFPHASTSAVLHVVFFFVFFNFKWILQWLQWHDPST